MDNKDLFMKIHLSEKEGKFMKFQKEFKESLFYMFFVLLKNYKQVLLIECISIILEYLQFLYFPFDSYVNNYLKIYSLMLNGKKKIFLRK
jgi:hypothetical protein